MRARDDLDRHAAQQLASDALECRSAYGVTVLGSCPRYDHYPDVVAIIGADVAGIPRRAGTQQQQLVTGSPAAALFSRNARAGVIGTAAPQLLDRFHHRPSEAGTHQLLGWRRREGPRPAAHRLGRPSHRSLPGMSKSRPKAGS